MAHTATGLTSALDLPLELLVLEDARGVLPLCKQEGPLSFERGPNEFDRRVRRLAVLLAAALRDEERRAMRELRELLDRDWPNLPLHAREDILRQAGEIIARIPRDRAFVARNRIEAAAIVLARRARRAAVRQFGLAVPVDQPPASVVRNMELALPTTRFVADEYVRRGNAFTVAATALVAAAVARGRSADQIETSLLDRVGGFIDRPAYLQGVATAVLTRARSSALLDTYAEAGVETYVVLEVLDERTCRKCRFMHGTEFSVESGRDLLGDLANQFTPAEIANANPFLREGRNAAGDPVIYIMRDGVRTDLAIVRDAAEGQVDRTGSFDPPADADQLTALGIGPPPYHPDCRGVIIPA